MNKQKSALLENWMYSNKATVRKKIRANKNNDLSLITDIERILRKRRGYVFSKPKVNEPVIALMSGGLDTTTVIATLLEVYKCRVFPLYINRALHHRLQVANSAKFFDTYFKKKYPTRYTNFFEMKLSIPPKEVKKTIIEVENELLANKNRKGIPLQPSLYAEYAVYYAKYLEETTGIKVRTIVGAWLPSNSTGYAYESLSSLRSVMLNICAVDHDFSWQFTSLPMEKELGFFFEKDVLVKIGNELGLPLEKTWTCYLGGTKHCGDCAPCWTRKDAFRDAGVFDQTNYNDNRTVTERVLHTQGILRKRIKLSLLKILGKK